MTEPKRAMEPKYAHVPPMRKEVISRQTAYYTQLFGMAKYSMVPWNLPEPCIITEATIQRMTRPIVTPTPKCRCAK